MDSILGRVRSSAQLKPGELIFDCNFESGNLGHVEAVSDAEYDLSIRPDTNNSKFRVWFYFSVSNVKAGQRVLLNIINFSKTKSLYREGMSPLVRSSSRKDWERMPSRQVFYYRSPRHKKNYILSFLFTFDREDDTYFFAYSYPFTYTDLQRQLHIIDTQRFPYVRRELLCRSVQNRRVDLLTITSPRNLVSDGRKKRMVFFSARVHPGETPASFVMQGIIDFLVSADPAAQILRDNIVFKIVPMLNPDGVFVGNYRCSYMGFDLNRHWQSPSMWSQPAIASTKRMLLEYATDPDTQLDFVIDIHAHTTMMNGFMYGNVREDEEHHEREQALPRLLDTISRDFQYRNTVFNRDPVKAGSARRSLDELLAPLGTHSYTLEVSFYCARDDLRGMSAAFTQESYMELGRNVCEAILEWYKLPNPRRKRSSPPAAASAM
eukprot:TRINITY_DN12107_c0_g1_i1.p1 TRINITY_DN12107_c0_g1~~TRINITY_DN12107_c0_g1_i1.p1  ORF type:complete len:435 (-),score=66.82 TRINITY_DN12107_c0_g1_i1:93-1397(-)